MIKLPKIFRAQTRSHAAARPFFDPEYYLATNPDIARGKIDPFVHYMKHGWVEGRDPSARFSTLYYKDRYLARAKAATNPLVHYGRLRPAKRERVATTPGDDYVGIQGGVIGPYLDLAFYRDAARLADDADAVLHYLTVGWRKGLEPRRGFSSASYLIQNPHARRLGVNPFYHFVSTYPLLNDGRRAPIGSTDAAAPRAGPALPPEEARRRDVMRAAFDERFYLAKQADVRASGSDALTHFMAAGVWEDRNPNEFFSVRYYRNRYGDEIAEGVNPFYHYLTVGKARGYKQNPFGDRVWPRVEAPPAEAWQAVTPAADIDAAGIVLIMPVYKGYDDTLAAIHSVLANTQKTAFALLVIDDDSPDDRLSAMLAELAGRGLFALVRNEENLGFVRTVNRGLATAGRRDVVLLNSDILVYGDWLDRLLRHAAGDHLVATITPFSNNATICSYPEFDADNRLQLEVSPDRLDAYTAVCNAGGSSSVPTGVGFCLYMRRAVIDAIGPLDAETFGRGYGEENDFCMRAAARGYRHLLAHDVFVYHSGSVSFGTTQSENSRAILDALLGKHPGYTMRVRHHIAADPARSARRRLDYYRFTRRITRKAAVFVLHEWGGGIETNVQHLSARLDEAGFDVVLLRIAGPTLLQPALPDGSRIAFPVEILEPLSLAKERDLFADWLRWLAPRLVHVHSLVSLDWASTRALTTLIAQTCPASYYTLHDYAPVCHRNNLVTPEQVYCGLPDDAVCRACIAGDPDAEEFVDPAERRSVYGAFLASNRLTFAPSADVAERTARKIPLAHAAVRPHEETLHDADWRAAPGASGILTVATVGALGTHKGADVIYALALDARARHLPIDFVIVGYSHDTVLMQSVRVRETGHYKSDAVAVRLLNEEGADLVLQPSIWPETFSYTLSLALAAGVPPVTFDLGAPAERLRALDEGAILDPRLAADPQRLNDALLALDVAALWRRRRPYLPRRYPNFVEAYYGPDVAD